MVRRLSHDTFASVIFTDCYGEQSCMTAEKTFFPKAVSMAPALS